MQSANRSEEASSHSTIPNDNDVVYLFPPTSSVDFLLQELSKPRTLHPRLILLDNACNATHNGAYGTIMVEINHGLHHDKSLQVTGTSEHKLNLKSKYIRRKLASMFSKATIILMVSNTNDVCKIHALVEHTDLKDTMVRGNVLNEYDIKPRRTFIYNTQAEHFNNLKILENVYSQQKCRSAIIYAELSEESFYNLANLYSNIRAIVFQHDRRISIMREPEMRNGSLNSASGSRTEKTRLHALLPSNSKTSNNKYIVSPFEYWPRLVLSSACTRAAVDAALSDFERRKFDAEYIRMVSEAYERVPNHTYRGYALLKKEDTKANRHIKMIPDKKMSICFYFGGSGAQWTGMGNSLKNLPIFWDTIQQCHDVLKPKGFDLIHVITDDNPEIFDTVNFVNTTVGQAAIQIALCDVLKSVGIVPDYICGCSLGEIPSGYADGCLTKEEAILITYYCALIAEETQFIPISKMFVGVDCNIIHQILPPGIDVAIYFGPGGCIIGGPTETILDYQKFLQNRGIYYKEPVPSLYPAHTSYFAPSKPRMIDLMKTVITKPKLRSRKWISTSTLDTEWNTEVAMYASAEYYTNFAHNPSYFQQAIRYLPENAVLIELAPHHGCTQQQLQLAAADVPTIPLMRKYCDDGVEFLSRALGKIYQKGVNLQINELYPFGEFAIDNAVGRE